MRQSPKGQSVTVNTHARSVCLCRLLEATQTIPLNPLTPAGVPVTKITLGRQTRSRIAVPAAWHRPQKSSISDGLHENFVLVNTTSPPVRYRGTTCARKVLYSAGWTANLTLPRDSSAFTRRRISIISVTCEYIPKSTVFSPENQ